MRLYNPAENAEWESGMLLPTHPLSADIEKLLNQSHSEWYTSWGDGRRIAAANKIINSIGELEGMTLVHPGDYGTDYENRCAHYAFGEASGQTWAEPQRDLGTDIWVRPIPFLKTVGFRMTKTAKPGDVVAYSFVTDIDECPEEYMEFNHFGVVNPDKTVTSKFNQGPVLKHPLEMVPSGYGNWVYFLTQD